MLPFAVCPLPVDGTGPRVPVRRFVNKLTKKVHPQHSGNSCGDKYAGRSTYRPSQRRFQPYFRGESSDLLGKSRFSKPSRKKKYGETSQRLWRYSKVPDVCNTDMTSLSIGIVQSVVNSQPSFQAAELKQFWPMLQKISLEALGYIR